MPGNRNKSSRKRKTDVYAHPIICGTFHRDTLNRVADIIDLLEQLDLSDGLTPSARSGLYWIHQMLGDAIKHVSEDLRQI